MALRRPQNCLKGQWVTAAFPTRLQALCAPCGGALRLDSNPELGNTVPVETVREKRFMTTLVRLADYRLRRSCIFFNRIELNQLLSVYSRRVARGEWRDYAIDHRKGVAVFSFFRHASGRPVYTLMKFAPGARRRGDYVLTHEGRRIKEGRNLADVLAILRTPALTVVSKSH